MSESRSDACPATLRGWLFFRHEEDRHLWCAVVHGHVLPGFLLAGAWRPQTREVAARSIGAFRQGGARQGVSLNGFYLFQAFGPTRESWPETADLPENDGRRRIPWPPCLKAA